MKKIDTEVSFTPSSKILKEINKWLIEEDKKTGDGFYCNWEVIKSAFEKNKLASISLEGKVVGFIIWRNYDCVATIDIAEIKPSHRSKGLGQILTNRLFSKFLSEDIFVVNLQCSPASSEPVWKKLGFQDIRQESDEDNVDYSENKQLYKILIPHLEQTSDLVDGEYIELWDNEPHKTSDGTPTWKWELVFEEGTRKLKFPLIHPAHYDWRIRWRLGEKIIKNDKVKYFVKEEIVFGKFIVISELPNPC